MKTLITLRDENFGLKTRSAIKWKERRAARCVLKRSGKIALLHVQKYAYHKLPGGGIKKGEDTKKALQREVAEEVGSKIVVGIPIGKSIEYRSKRKVRQISICFLATETEKGKPSYTKMELRQGFRLEWYTLKRAISLLMREKPSNYEGMFIVRRDLKFLQEAERLLSFSSKH